MSGELETPQVSKQMRAYGIGLFAILLASGCSGNSTSGAGSSLIPCASPAGTPGNCEGNAFSHGGCTAEEFYSMAARIGGCLHCNGTTGAEFSLGGNAVQGPLTVQVRDETLTGKIDGCSEIRLSGGSYSRMSELQYCSGTLSFKLLSIEGAAELIQCTSCFAGPVPTECQ